MHVMSGLGLRLISLGMGLMLTACSREPRHTSPRLGEIVSIQPIAIDMQLASTAPKNVPLKLNIMWGGRMLTGDKGDTTLNFYEKSGRVRYSKSWNQLSNAYRETDCSNQAIATLDGSLMGSALICDGSLNLDGIVSIEGVDAKGEKRSATSWSVYMLNENVAAASIGLY
ncbi:MAG TPA: hypothetical protein VFO10_22980 [Oligoflexus sp.]|uniref:hypothetical protein n=1 Tax=Oligoflexus sp. TaxID=1971216 RepID=UPI002D7E2311|nr:hypothetical protein [Oligoflexus sp.]HET9240146.1 hypothetical protein [Oligoflexus sp.]